LSPHSCPCSPVPPAPSCPCCPVLTLLCTCPVTAVLRMTCPNCHFLAICPLCCVQVDLSQLSCINYPVLHVLLWLYYPPCLVPAVPWLSHVLVILFLSCLFCLFPAILPGWPVQTSLFWLTYLSCPFPAVMPGLSSMVFLSHCPLPAVLSWHVLAILLSSAMTVLPLLLYILTFSAVLSLAQLSWAVLSLLPCKK
jgi:hypothetical protein